MNIVKTLEALLLTTAMAFAGGNKKIEGADRKGETKEFKLERGDSVIYISEHYFIKKPDTEKWYAIQKGFSALDTRLLRRNKERLMVYTPLPEGVQSAGPIKVTDYKLAIPQPLYLRDSERINKIFEVFKKGRDKRKI